MGESYGFVDNESWLPISSPSFCVCVCVCVWVCFCVCVCVSIVPCDKRNTLHIFSCIYQSFWFLRVRSKYCDSDWFSNSYKTKGNFANKQSQKLRHSQLDEDFAKICTNIHPCLTDPSNVLILLGVSSQVLGGELETQICLGWRQICLGFAWGKAFFAWGGV